MPDSVGMNRRSKGRLAILLAFVVGVAVLYAGSGAVRGWLVHTIHAR